MGWWAV